MSGHVLLNLLNELRKRYKCQACRAFNLFSNELIIFNNTGARMFDSIYHMTLESHFWHENVKILPSFMQRQNGHNSVTLLNL